MCRVYKVLTSHKSKNLYQLLIDDVDPNQLADHLSHRLTKQDVEKINAKTAFSGRQDGARQLVSLAGGKINASDLIDALCKLKHVDLADDILEVCMALSPSVRKDRNYVKLIRDYDQRRAVADSDADSEQSLAHVSPTGPATPTQPTPSCASRVYNLNNCSVQIGNDNSQTVHNGQSAESDSRAAATYNPESTDSEADESEASNDEDVVIEVEDGPLTQSANESVSLQTDAAMSPETLGVQLRRSSVRDVNSDDTEPKQIEPGTSYQRSSDSYQNEQLPSAVSIDQPRSSTGNHSGLQNSGAGTEDINESMTAVKALFEPSVPSYLDDQDTEGVDALGGHDSADRMYSAPEDGVSVSCSNPAGRQSASAPCSATAAGNATGSSDVPVDERTGSEYSSPASVRFTNGVGNSSEELNNQPASSGQNESVPNGIMPQQLTIKEAALTLLTVILGVW